MSRRNLSYSCEGSSDDCGSSDGEMSIEVVKEVIDSQMLDLKAEMCKGTQTMKDEVHAEMHEEIKAAISRSVNL